MWNYLLSFRVTEMHYKWSYLELCITFFIPSLSFRVLEFISNSCRLKAKQLNLHTFLALWPLQKRFFCGSFVLPHLHICFTALVMNSITALCILLSYFLICTGVNIKVDIDKVMIEKKIIKLYQ